MVGAVYRPPDGRLSQELDELRSQLLDVIGAGKPIYLLGDLNVDLLRPEKTETVQYSALLTDLNLVQLVSQPTHPGSTPSLIDHIVTNQTEAVIPASVVPAHASDHDLIVAEAPFPRARRQSREVCMRSMERVDFDHQCLDLLTSDWSSMCGAGDVTAAYSAFLKILNAAAFRSCEFRSCEDIHCPVKRVRFKRRECPWLTLNEELQDLQLQRDSARREWDALRADASRHRYTALRNKFKTALAKARSEFFSARMSPKDMWKNLRAYAISSNTTKDPDVGLDTETADRFNTYFAGVGQRIAAELAEQPVGSVPPRPPIVISAGFRVRPVTISELGDALRKMSNSAAVGCDGVSLKIVRRCFAVLAPHILFMINMSIVSGVVPPEWKQAIVVGTHS